MGNYISLKHEPEFVPVQDGDHCYYGGDQAWYATEVRRHSACGTVAAANIMAYGARNEAPEKKSYTLAQYLFHMNAVYCYVNPLRVPLLSENAPPFNGFCWSVGVWPMGRLIRGVKRFTKAVGKQLRPVGYKNGREAADTFIEAALGRDCPVALLIGDTKKLHSIQVTLPDGRAFTQTDFSLHWVTITALRRENHCTSVKVSTWGGYAWLPLSSCFKTLFIKSRMCYFILEK